MRDCGHFDIYIDKNGKWFHQGHPFMRRELVNLFSTVVRLDKQGQYWLETPAEKGRIDVEDVPFLIERVKRDNDKDNIICETQTNKAFTISENHPIEFRNFEDSKSLYVLVKDNLWGRFNRNCFYDLCEWADCNEEGTEFTLVSAGHEFRLKYE